MTAILGDTDRKADPPKSLEDKPRGDTNRLSTCGQENKSAGARAKRRRHAAPRSQLRDRGQLLCVSVSGFFKIMVSSQSAEAEDGPVSVLSPLLLWQCPSCA